jgi:hypothetical protein
LSGQQGYTSKETKRFELHDFKQNNKGVGPDDDTETMCGKPFGRGVDSHIPFNAPRGPRNGHKRVRVTEDGMVPAEDSLSLPYDG